MLVNALGWFGGKGRPAIAFIHAAKNRGQETGCEVEILTSAPPPTPTGVPLLEAAFDEALPTSAREEAFTDWARRSATLDGHPITGAFGVAPHFADPGVNLGDVATGRPKPIIDCLWPILGGSAGAPHDHRVTELRLSKAAAPGGTG